MRIYIDMVADLFHVGHLNLIKRASILGEYLLVGVHSDKAVETYKRKPVINELQRYEIIRACKYVDEIIENAPLIITEEFIKKYNIDCVIGGEVISEEIKKQHATPIKLGIIKYLPRTKGVSTTDIIERIKNDKF